MITTKTRVRSVVLLALLPVAAAAQTPAVGNPPSGYDAGGRRDPFVSLIAPARKDIAPVAAPVKRATGTGLASVMVTEVTVKGILRAGSSMLAILEAPGGQTFIARRQDRLLDGSVKSIEPDAVVFAETIADGQGKTHARDVRRLLRPVSGGGR